MDLYTKFVSGALFPLHEAAKQHNSLALRRRLEQSQWWSLSDLQALQVRRLRDFLTAAKAHVPYYQGKFSAIDLASIDDVGDLQRLPFLSKKDIRNNLDDLKSRNARCLTRLNTGGSTGEPMIFHVGRDRVTHDVAAKWRATRWWDVDIGDREIVLWGSPIEIGTQDHIKAFRDRLLRTKLFSAFKMSPAQMDEILDYIEFKRPKMLFGYPSAIALLAERARAQARQLANCSIIVTFVTAEKCYPYQRELIEDSFGCRVANGYGGRDAGFIAHECPQGGLHICAEDIIVELVDERGNAVSHGELGEIVVTHLATGDFPFVRYKTGDMARFSVDRCSCGRGLPTFAEVSGRSTDFIRLSDGSLMHGLGLIYVVRDLPGVASFKIIQERQDLIRIQLQIEAGYSPAVESRLREGMRERLGEDMRVEIEHVDDIPPEASGKYRYVVNAIVDRAVQQALGAE